MADKFVTLENLSEYSSKTDEKIREFVAGEIVPPVRMYNMSGMTNEWFLKNTLLESIDNYYIRLDESVTAHYNANFDRRHTFISPTKDTQGGGTVKYWLESVHGKKSSQAFEVSYLRASTSGLANKTVKALFIGDSLIDNGYTVTELKNLFDADESGARIELYGTRGTEPYNHEGYAGYGSYDILHTSSYNNITNAFINPETGVFDFSYYCTSNSIPTLDYVAIQIGVNDIFRPMNGTTTAENIQTMIDSIRAYMPDVKIIVATPPQPYLGGKYDCLDFRPAEYAHKFRLGVTKDISAAFSKNVSERQIYIAPVHAVVDTDYDFKMTERNVNADSSITEEYCTDITHYDLSGHKKVAKQYYCLMKYVGV